MDGRRVAKVARKLARGQFSELAARLLEECRRLEERRRYWAASDDTDWSQSHALMTCEAQRSYRISQSKLDFGSTLRSHRDDMFMPGFASRESFADCMGKCAPGTFERIQNTAESIVENKFPVFAFGCVSYGDPVRWNYDPVHNVCAPGCFYGDIDYLDPAVVGDSKIVWELSRMQWVYDLGQAYLLTGDERYSGRFMELLQEWCTLNRPYHGINYCSALEAAFRIHALAWAVWFFKDSCVMTSGHAQRIYAMIRLSAMFVLHHLSRYFSPNTHLLGEAYSLFLAGELFPELEGAHIWRRVGYDALLAELDRQFTPDGMHAELSTAYHGYALEFILSIVSVCRQRNVEINPIFERRLREATAILESLQRPDGTWPHIGDEDGGRLFFLSRVSSGDFRPLLEACRVALGEHSPISFVDSFWFNGIQEKGSLSRRVTESRSFPKAGVVTFRSPIGLHASFHCGPFGYGKSPHSHADMLHLDVSCGSDNFLVDPGTGTYTADLKVRNLYRSAAAHNGPCVIGASLEDPEDPFGWLQKPDCCVDAFNTLGDAEFCRASYQVWMPGSGCVSVSRAILFVHDKYWVVTDTVCSLTLITAETHFVTPLDVALCANGVHVVGREGRLAIVPLRRPGEELACVVHPFAVYDDYLSKRAGTRITFTGCPHQQSTTTYLLLPVESERMIPQVVAVRGARNGLTARLALQESTLVVGVRLGRGDELSTDAEVVLLESCRGCLKRVIIVNGSFAQHREETGLHLDRVVDMADARCIEGTWRLNATGPVSVVSMGC